MKINELLNIIEKEFPKSSAYSWIENGVKHTDTIGLLNDGKRDANKIMLTLDITLDVLLQAFENEVDTIISHHPLYFGSKEEWMKKHKMDEAKFSFLEGQNLNIITIHTNADFNQNSISYNIAKMLNLKEISHILNNQAVTGKLENRITSNQLENLIKTNLDLNYDFRSNLNENHNFEKITICSGSCGDIIYSPEIINSVFIPGEIKHHHWIYAFEHEINVLEIGHFAEKVFKNLMKDFLSKETKLDIFLSNEENGY